MQAITEQIENHYDDVQQAMLSLERWESRNNADVIIERILHMCLMRLEETFHLVQEIDPNLQPIYIDQWSWLNQWVTDVTASNIYEKNPTEVRSIRGFD
jgi:hypothetical protein